VIEGIGYLRGHPVLLMSFVVDIIAMVFGMPRALFPEIAHESFSGPEEGGLAFALLFAGIPAGAVIGGVFSGWVSRIDAQGKAVVWCIIVWGLAMVGFGVAVGVADHLPDAAAWMLGASVVMLIVGGAADMASAAFRQSILQASAADEVRGRIQGTTGYDGFEDCDLVLEAVVEELAVKQEVFATLRKLAPHAIFASNTSSLSLAEMGADVGLHFFNPVAVLPLVEIVRHDDTPDEAVATAWDVCRKLGKRGVVTKDAPGFVVNRVLTRMTSVLMDSLEHGNTVEETDEAIVELGMPMAPSVLLQLVGPRVANHVLVTMHEAYPDRFPLSPTLANFADGKDEVVILGDRRRTPEELTEAVLEALADEIGRLLDEGVVGSAQDVDTCLLLGAGWPFFLGGITPHLDRTGASERVLGRRLADTAASARA
jgi:3-hydroxyacyl-CoA dehydrogenase